MEKTEKVKTLKYVLFGLYENEKDIEEFLKNYNFSSEFISNFSFYRFILNLKKYKNLQMNYFLSYIFFIRDKFCEFKGIEEKKEKPLFLIRIDDFPHWELDNQEFKKFNEIMEKFEIPYLCGIIPKLSLNRKNPLNTKFRILVKEDIEIIKHPLIEIGMHGYTHQTIKYGKSKEFAGIDEKKAEEKIMNGLKTFKNFELEPIAFIPPFDEIDLPSYKIISKYFKIITGGPSSTKNLGYKVSPCFFENSIYVASYRPLCNSCFEIYKFLKENEIERKIILPIVIHWANEAKNNYEYLKELLKIIKGNVIRWKDLLLIISF